jgi:hypothetical protein
MTKKCETLNRIAYGFDWLVMLIKSQKINITNQSTNQQFHNLSFLFLIFTLFLFPSCNQPTQGCRDINATNYDVTADEDCEDDCCQLPELKMQFSHKIEQRVGGVDTVINFNYNTSYILPASLTDTFSFQKIKCYFSDFRLVDMDGVEVQVNDQLTIDLEGDDPDSITIVDDVFLFDAASSNYTLGEFDEANTFEGLKFRVGLQSELFNTNPDIAPVGSAFVPDSINYEEDYGYIPQKYVFFLGKDDPVQPDSTVVRIFEPVEITLNSDPFALVTGFDATLRMTVRYDRLFENIVFDSMTVEDNFIQNIVSNLPNVFTLDSLDQN